tara:strand:+ start:781 stop:1923 length:1143 start_codon:yes stop_codon:yes gene_type:complete
MEINNSKLDLSIVIPCLNEAETIVKCISKCKNKIAKLNIKAEVIVADNGSTDNSIELAQKAGAKIVKVKKRGYGSALIGGINSAIGKYVIIGDADDSYDFDKIDEFYNKLLEGYDIVQGCRFPIGGGKIEKSAMPVTHKYIGNPLFSLLSKLFFSLPFNDVYCGYRGFDRNIFLKLDHFSNGMVFAIENLIKFKVYGAKCAEIPIVLHKDGRKKYKSHLNTISDGWKTLRFLLVTCPRWIYFFPSLLLLIFSAFNLTEFVFFKDKEDNYLNITNFIQSIIYFLLSFQIFMFGLFSSLFAVKLKFLKSNLIKKFFDIFKLRYAFYISLLGIIIFFIIYIFKESLQIQTITLDILKYSITFFSILIILNSLYVSLITLDDKS